MVATRETREGWPLLTVETETTGDSWEYILKGSSLGWVVVVLVQIDFYPGCSSQPSKKIIFFTAHFFTLFVPISQQPGHAAVLGRLSKGLPATTPAVDLTQS